MREFKLAVLENDVTRISSISGIGKKTAERIVVELKDKISEADALEATSGSHDVTGIQSRDAVLALVSLGYKKEDASKMVLAAEKKAGANSCVEDLVRMALAR